MLRRTLRVLTLSLGVAVVVGTMLVATGGAAKPRDTATCSLSAGTTFTWIAGTTVIDYWFYQADGTTETGNGYVTPTGNGPGSYTLPSGTPANSATLKAIFGNRHGPAAEQFFTCS
jgi:hypothetical protein